MGNIPNISVKIMQANEIHFELQGNYTCDGMNKNLNGKFMARMNGEQIDVMYDQFVFASRKEFNFKPGLLKDEIFELKDVVIGIDFHWEQKENQRFQGELKLMVENNKVIAVNILDVETYLTSVISSEMRADSSTELLKAHAVISRSWLFAQKEKQHQLAQKVYQTAQIDDMECIRWYDREDHLLFDVCADDHCQRYQGITRAHNPNVVKAIQATSGQVLISNGMVCDTRYSKCCGGASESFEKVWEPIVHPYLQKIDDNKNSNKPSPDLTLEQNATQWIKNRPAAFCNTNNKEVLSQVLNDYDQSSEHFYRWKISYQQDELAGLIKKKSGIDFGQIIDLIPVERGHSARLAKLKIIGTKKTLIVGKELEIRRWLSPSHLYSSAFIVDKENIQNGIPQTFILSGAGWGHGVGLCQIGAAVMGHMGYSYRQILEHYFIGTSLQNKY
jgi:stage II sporulation protein D